MTSLPEQFTAATSKSQAQVRAQFEAQFDFFQKVSTQALESASRFASLNLAVSRDSVERSTRAAQTLLASRDPRDLLVFGGHAEEQVRSLFDYSRELMGIASGVKLYAPLLAPANVPAIAPQLAARAVEAVDAVVNETVAAAEEVTETEVVVVAEPKAAPQPEPVHAAAEPALVVEAEPATEAAAEPVADLLATEPAPIAEPTPIAVAVGQGEAHAGVAPHPAAAPMQAESTTIQVPKLASSRRKGK